MLKKYERMIKGLLNDIKYKESGDELHCCCPLPGHDDKHASFSINLQTGAYICFACGEKGSITDFVAKIKNITNKEACKYIQEQEIIDFKPSDNKLGYTLEDYAAEKGLNIEKLNKYGLSTSKDDKSVIIPYYNENGNLVRCRLRYHPESDIRFSWESGTQSICLYGLWSIKNLKDDYVILVEGESDCHCAWEQDLQVIGVPGANMFKKEYAHYFDNFKKIYIHRENDNGGTTFVNKIAEILPTDKLFIVSASKVDETCKDLAALHLKGKLNLKTLLATAEPIVVNRQNVNRGKLTHAEIGKNLIDSLELKYFNGNLYYYTNGVYHLGEDKMLENYIVKHIWVEAKKILRKESIDFVKSWLADENVSLKVDKNYINFKNGLYNLKERKLIEHTSDIFTVNQLNVNYLDEIISNPTVDKFFDDLMLNNKEREKSLYQIIGYCMTNRTNIQKVIIFYGPSASNGKSTFSKILTSLFGEENVCMIDLAQFQKRFGTHEIANKLLNIVPELPKTKIKDVGVFKALVTGDKIMADVKYKERIAIVSHAKHLFSSNYLPQVDDSSDGFFRRIHIVLFENKFDVSTSNFDLDSFLTQENLDYIANRALREYEAMLESGHLEFANAEESKAILDKYKRVNDTVLSFLKDEDEDYNIYGKDVLRKDIWEFYKFFCSDNRFTPVPKQQLYEELEKKYGFIKKIVNGYYYFYKARNDLK